MFDVFQSDEKSYTYVHLNSPSKAQLKKNKENFNGSNTDGSFTTAVSNSFLSPLEKNPIAADLR